MNGAQARLLELKAEIDALDKQLANLKQAIREIALELKKLAG